MTLASLLDAMLADEPGRPLVTCYDERTGERVELSVATWANWVAKGAGLLVDECDLERGDVLRLALPPHWMGTVLAVAAWSAGLRVEPTDSTADTAAEPDAVVCGPAEVESWAPASDRVRVLACALLPLGVRFTDPLPHGVLDVGVEIWSQPDAFVAIDPASEEDEALGGRSQGDLLAAAADDDRVATGDRLLVTTDPGSADGLTLLLAVLVRRGSLVLVLGEPTGERLERISADELVTRRA